VSLSVNRSRAKAAASKGKSTNVVAGQAEVVARTVTQGATADLKSVPRTSEPRAASTARKPTATESIAVSDKSPRIPAVPKRPARAKPAKLARRPKRRINGAHAGASAFRPLSKAEPAILRRPKRVVQVRRRKSKGRASLVLASKTKIATPLRPQ